MFLPYACALFKPTVKQGALLYAILLDTHVRLSLIHPYSQRKNSPSKVTVRIVLHNEPRYRTFKVLKLFFFVNIVGKVNTLFAKVGFLQDLYPGSHWLIPLYLRLFVLSFNHPCDSCGSHWLVVVFGW